MKTNLVLFLAVAGLLVFSCARGGNKGEKTMTQSQAAKHNDELNDSELKTIYFAGGCFWGVEEYFSRIPGVADVTSGYANGKTENPTYQQVCYENTGHTETVRLRYDPKKVSLKTLAVQFFKIIDPVAVNRQGNDRGIQYRSGIYYSADTDLPVLTDVFNSIQMEYADPIATELEPLKNFYPAEEYHQDYLKKNPDGYCHIDFSSLDSIVSEPEEKSSVYIPRYPKPNDAAIKNMLSAEQFAVTQQGSTERAFTGEYWDSHEKGLYVDVVTGEPLFASSDKFDSNCGWPSFAKPLADEVIDELEDSSHGMLRTEVRSRSGNSHLGHVFDDGPKELGGLRYCINSAALRFIPYEKMKETGYGDYMWNVAAPSN